jgi:hypothetical protein
VNAAVLSPSARVSSAAAHARGDAADAAQDAAGRAEKRGRGPRYRPSGRRAVLGVVVVVIADVFQAARVFIEVVVEVVPLVVVPVRQAPLRF